MVRTYAISRRTTRTTRKKLINPRKRYPRYSVSTNMPRYNTFRSIRESSDEYTETYKFILNTYTGAATDVLQGRSFNLSQTVDSSNFAAIFDMYKINYVTIQVIPVTQAPLCNPTAIATIPQALFIAIDRDDDGNPSSVGVVLNYSNVQMFPPGQGGSFSFRPRVQSDIVTTSTTLNGLTLPPSWIDMAVSTAEHYGIKVGIIGAGTGAEGYPAWQVIAGLNVSMKGRR